MKFLIENRSPLLGFFEVLVDFGERHDEIEVETQDDARQKHDEDGKGGVLEIRQLNFARPARRHAWKKPSCFADNSNQSLQSEL